MIPPSYTFRNITKHKVTSILTILGIALVVFVFTGSMMLTEGLKTTMVATGTNGNVIAIRKASQTEVMSIIYYSQANILKTFPEIAGDTDDTPLFAGELYVLIAQKSRTSGDEANVVVRGIGEKSMALRPNVKLIEGRMWDDPGSEIIAGKAAAENFVGCGLGEKIKFGARSWTVVGIFDAGGSAFDSEIWTEYQQASDVFDRPIYSSVTFRMKDTTQFAEMTEKIENDPRLPLDVKREKVYYESQSKTFSTFVGIMGTVISIIFSLGAIIGAMITMYAAVANRVTEIGTLRSLGFSRLSILTSFLFESSLIAFFGGAIGIAGAFFLKFYRVSTMNWDTFSDIAFNFDMSWGIAIGSIIFALVMGFIGGVLPAIRAARMKIVDSLRA
jgi:putative ABC transport system permease protein